MCLSLDMFRNCILSVCLIVQNEPPCGVIADYTTICNLYHVSLPNRFKMESFLFSFSDFNNVSYTFLAFPPFTVLPKKITGKRFGNNSGKKIVLLFWKIGHRGGVVRQTTEIIST